MVDGIPKQEGFVVSIFKKMSACQSEPEILKKKKEAQSVQELHHSHGGTRKFKGQTGISKLETN